MLAKDINARVFLIFTESGRSYKLFKEVYESLDEYKSDCDGTYSMNNNGMNNINNYNNGNNNCNDNSNNSVDINSNNNVISNNTTTTDNKNTNKKIQVVISTPNENTYLNIKNDCNIIPILMNYRNKYKDAMIKQCIAKLIELNIVNNDDIIVSVYGPPKGKGVDTISCIKVDDSNPILKLYKYLNSVDKVKSLVINEVLNIAMELGMEGREGKPVGTIFIIGDSDNVLKMSSQLILNPFENHNAIIFDKDVKGTIKELSSIDGAFVISDKGNVLSAGRYIECSGGNINLPSGLGARHHAAANISKHTDAIAITVSESGGIVRVFKDGEIFTEINPNKIID